MAVMKAVTLRYTYCGLLEYRIPGTQHPWHIQAGKACLYSPQTSSIHRRRLSLAYDVPGSHFQHDACALILRPEGEACARTCTSGRGGPMEMGLVHPTGRSPSCRMGTQGVAAAKASSRSQITKKNRNNKYKTEHTIKDSCMKQ